MNRAASIGVSVLVAVTLAACSGDGGSPTSPSAFPSSGATTISGTAVAGGGTTVSGQRGRLSTPTFGALDSHPSGLRVCVVGTGICVEVSEPGSFELSGDLTGDDELHFTGPDQDVRVTVNDVQTGETIIVSVSLHGNSGSLQVESRHHGHSEHKVEVRHVTGNGSYHLIEVDESAFPAHEAHGDGVPGGVVPTNPDLRFDEDCGLPAIDIEKFTNGEDADFEPGPSILVNVNDKVTWTYVVTNTGTVPLTNIEVLDDIIAMLPCDEPDELLPMEMESFECVVEGTATEGQYSNVGTVTADWEIDGEVVGSVTDTDASHYIGEFDTEEPEDGNEKVQLCHRTGNGSYHLIEVSVDAEPAHLAHGDQYPAADGSCPVSSQ